MKRKDFLKSLGVGSLLLVPGVKSATDEPKVVEKEVVKPISVDRASLVQQARYEYRDWIIRYIDSRPNDYGEWVHRFIGVSKTQKYTEKEVQRDGLNIYLKDIDLLEVKMVGRMYPPKI